MMIHWLRLLTVVVAMWLAIWLASAALSRWLRCTTDGRIVRSLDEIPADVRIVVLGCRPRLTSMRSNRYFIARVASAAAAYHHTRGRRILCSGCRHPDGADEAAELARLLEAAAVPSEVIDLDKASSRTIDSIDCLAQNFATGAVLLVTQDFHMPRALFLARARGLDAWGLIAGGSAPRLRGRLRERLAELRAVLDLFVGRRHN